MTNYEWLDNLTYADIAFKAYGKTIEEVFEHAALAVQEAMVDRETVFERVRHTITIKEKTLEQLLYMFLEQLLFLKDSQQLFFNSFITHITEEQEGFILVAQAFGEESTDHMVFNNDVKAITMHEFYVKETKKVWEAQVVLDV